MRALGCYFIANCYEYSVKRIRNINMPLPGGPLPLPTTFSTAMKNARDSCESDCPCEQKDKSGATRGVVTEALFATSGGQQKDAFSKTRDRQNFDSSQIVFVDKVDGLSKITNDNVQLAVWQQSSAPKFTEQLSSPSIMPEDLPSFEGMVPAFPGMVAEIMKKYLWTPYPLRSHEKRKQALNEEGIDELVNHVDGLVQIFADISKDSGFLGNGEEQMPFVYVKLQVITNDSCKFWHQDCVPFRLLTTYRGPCTEWVEPAYSKLTLENRQDDSNNAKSLSHCDVALFKGRGDTDATLLYEQPGIVHRSPRMKSGECRLMLVIDIPQEGWHFE